MGLSLGCGRKNQGGTQDKGNGGEKRNRQCEGRAVITLNQVGDYHWVENAVDQRITDSKDDEDQFWPPEAEFDFAGFGRSAKKAPTMHRDREKSTEYGVAQRNDNPCRVGRQRKGTRQETNH